MTIKELCAAFITARWGDRLRVRTAGGTVDFASAKGAASGEIHLSPAITLFTHQEVEEEMAKARADGEESRRPVQATVDTGWIEVRSADSTEDVTLLVNLNGCTAVTMPIGDGRMILQLASGETVPVVATDELKARVRAILGVVAS